MAGLASQLLKGIENPFLYKILAKKRESHQQRNIGEEYSEKNRDSKSTASFAFLRVTVVRSGKCLGERTPKLNRILQQD